MTTTVAAEIDQFPVEQRVTIQDWGAIGELVGAVAILITLIYLATQVRYARLTTTDFNQTSKVEGIRQLNGALFQNDNARVAWFKSVGPMNHQLNSDMAETLDRSFDDAVLVVLLPLLRACGADHRQRFRRVLFDIKRQGLSMRAGRALRGAP